LRVEESNGTHQRKVASGFDQEKLTRRQLIQNLAFTATAHPLQAAGSLPTLLSRMPTIKVRATLEELVRDSPEVGLQVAAYLDGKLVVDAWAGRADTLP
jgi:hypothetical protein